jgi:hypothetical protein
LVLMYFHCFIHFFTFWHYKMPQIHVFPLAIELAISSRRLIFPSDQSTQNLDATFCIYYWSVTKSMFFSVNRAEEHICILTHVSISICTSTPTI